MNRTPLADRLWAKVDKTETCWLWTGARTRLGYGQIGHGGQDGKVVVVHRVAYELLVGPIPEGLELDHLCHVRRCVNPAHLEPVTHLENMRRGHFATKTHCPRAHPYDSANTLVSNGRRYCKTCARMWAKKRRAKEPA